MIRSTADLLEGRREWGRLGIPLGLYARLNPGNNRENKLFRIVMEINTV